MHILLLLATFHLYGPRMDYGGAHLHPYARVNAPECLAHIEYLKVKNRVLETLVIERDPFCRIELFPLLSSGRVHRVEEVGLEPPKIF